MRHALLAAALILAVSLGSAQEISRAIFDEIEDTGERDAFRGVWEAAQPHIQRELATRLVEQYPQSILLREAYELAARASLATGDLAAALGWAKRSLRLMPENPFLLVMTADTAAKLGDFDLAVTCARDALRYLEHAKAPSPISPQQWPHDRARLRAAAFFVIGRVAAIRQQYKEAEQSLITSLTLNHEDMEALYTIGVVRMAVRADDGAARAFARVAQADVAMSPAARESLRALFVRSGNATGISFDAWAASLKWSPPEPAQPVAEPNQPGKYAGSGACRECHQQVYDAWKSTGMAKMFRPYEPAAIVGDFSSRQTVADRARTILEGSRHFIEIRKGDTHDWTRYPVDYVIGSKWQQAYATRLPDSRLLVFPIQYSRMRSEWVNYWKILDAPGYVPTSRAFTTFPPMPSIKTPALPATRASCLFRKVRKGPQTQHFENRASTVKCATVPLWITLSM